MRAAFQLKKQKKGRMAQRLLAICSGHSSTHTSAEWLRQVMMQMSLGWLMLFSGNCAPVHHLRSACWNSASQSF
jgi:hypothetical protein